MTSIANPQIELFRKEVRQVLADFGPVDGFYRRDANAEHVHRLYRTLGERNWLAISWPEQYGGQGRPPVYEFVLWNEMAYALAARPSLAAGVVARALMHYGSSDQHARFLPGIRSGELQFSLGYSEPEAGSDLAAVRTRAHWDRTEYVLDGEKRWTSYAHDSDYLWTLARTGTLEERGRGLTLFIVPLEADGIEISPIATIDGERLNEVRLNEVRVSADNRVGEEGQGWTIVGNALASERHLQFPPKRLRRDLEDLTSWFRERGRLNDDRVRHALAELSVKVLECEVLSQRVLSGMENGEDVGVHATFNKYAGTQLAQEIARTAYELGGVDTLTVGQQVEFLWRQTIMETIGGGTSEIMRDLIARRYLAMGGSK